MRTTTRRMLLFCAILTPPVFAASASPLSPAGEEGLEEQVTRLYDVSSLAMELEPDLDHNFKLATSLWMHSTDELISEGNSIDVSPAADELVNLLIELMQGEFEYEGRSVRAVDGGRILVCAPEAVHKRVRETLAGLDEIINAEMELTIDVVEIDPSSELPFPGRGVLPRSQVEPWLASAAQSGTSHQFRLGVRADRPAELDLTRTLPVVLDYDVEIAQAATIADPIVSQIKVGTYAYVTATPAPGGVSLSLVLRCNGLLGEVRERSLRMGDEIRTDAGMIQSTASSVYQTYDLTGRSFGVDAFLKGDQALILQNRVDLSRDRRCEVFVLRWTGGALPWLQRVRSSGSDGRELIALNHRYMEPLNFRATGRLVDAGPLPFRLMEWISGGTEEGLLGVRLGRSDANLAEELIASQYDSFFMANYGNLMFVRPSEALAVQEGNAKLARLQGLLAGLDQGDGMVDVSVKLTRLGKFAGTPIQATFPLRIGYGAAVALGIENPTVADLDVEVAQDASTSDAIVMAEFEGLALWARASKSPRGDLILDLSVGASQASGTKRVLDIGRSDLEQSPQDQLMARQRLTFRADQTGPMVAVIGDAAAGKGGEGGLRLEISIAR